MSNVLRALGKAAGVVGAGFGGYAEDQQQRVKNRLAEQEATRAADRDKVLALVDGSQIDANNALAESRRNPTPRVQIAPDGSAILPVGHRIKKNLDGSFSVEKDDQTAPSVDVPKVESASSSVVPSPPVEAPKPPAGLVPASPTSSLVVPPQDKPLNFARPKTEPSKTFANYVDAKGGVHLTTGDSASARGWTRQVGGGGSSASANARGLGQGGVFGAGSGIGSVNEMVEANPNLKMYERNFIDALPTADLTAVDRFRQRLADDLQTHGIITAAVASEAERELAKHNPDLVIYARNLKQWLVADLNLSRGATDARQRLDMAVSGLAIPLSSMPAAQRKQYIEQVWSGRDARVSGLKQSADAATKMLGRIIGESGTGGVPNDAGEVSDDEFKAGYANATAAGAKTDAQVEAWIKANRRKP